eukprot:6175457-Pleurochrysis_carterae.AAC.1
MHASVFSPVRVRTRACERVRVLAHARVRGDHSWPPASISASHPHPADERIELRQAHPADEILELRQAGCG